MTGWDVLDSAHQALRAVVQGVGADGWDRPTPCPEWTVTQVLRHAAGDQVAWAAAVGGGPGPQENPFTPSAQHLAAPLAFLDEALATAGRAWAAVGQDAGEVGTPLPQG